MKTLKMMTIPPMIDIKAGISFNHSQAIITANNGIRYRKLTTIDAGALDKA
jgi:hypothetical protein